MEEIIRFLQENPVQFLATVGLDGKPKVRPFQFMFAEGGKLWFCTGNQKKVYAELQKNPYFELSAASADNRWVRVSGKAVFADNIAVKNKIVASNPLVASIYKSGDNKAFMVFYVADGEAVLSDFTGAPPKSVPLPS